MFDTERDGQRGGTACQRIRGRPFRHYLINFGESILLKHPVKGPKHNPTGNRGAQGTEGIFLGFNTASNNFKAATKEAYATSRTMTRRPMKDRWDAESIAQTNVTPWSLADKPEPRVRFSDPAEDDGRANDTALSEAPR